MRVDISPRRVNVVPGTSVPIAVGVFNTSDIISAQRIRVLGVDAAWVQVDREELSLFPEEHAISTVIVSLPAGIPAGVRRVTIQVREVTPPMATASIDVDLVVASRQDLRLHLNPTSITAGSAAEVSLTVTNLGNDQLDLALGGDDDEERMRFAFDPPVVALAPGEVGTTRVRLSGRRPWVGAPKVRTFQIHAGEGDSVAAAHGAFIQRARLTRGLLSLIGLLVAMSVFAAVITFTLGQVVDTSTENRQVLLQAIRIGQTSGTGTDGSITGRVTLQTTSAPVGVPGVTVQAYDAKDLSQAIVGTATDAAGKYRLSGLGSGSYKVEFQGAGFSGIWYPSAVAGDSAGPVEVKAGKATGGIDVRLGGLPAQVSGKVIADSPIDAAGASVAIQVSGGLDADATAIAAAPAPGTSPKGATVATVTTDASGVFVVDKIPSPATYDLVVSRSGYAVEHQTLELGTGEIRAGIEVKLRKGDGSIAGTVSTTSGSRGDKTVPLGDATVTATDGRSTFSTVSLNVGSIGAFRLPAVPTPGTYSLTVSAPGYATSTLAIGLSSAQQASGLSVTLTPGSGTISGTVRLSKGNVPTGGVTVTATDGKVAISTVSLSKGKVGSFELSGLAVPNTYTVSFARADLLTQSQSVTLDPLASAGSDREGLVASMATATATLYGTTSEIPAEIDDQVGPTCADKPATVTKPSDKGAVRAGEILVTLTSGTTVYRTSSVSGSLPRDPPEPDPFQVGSYELAGLAPGTYVATFAREGSAPVNELVTLAAGQRRSLSPRVSAQSSVHGSVDADDDHTCSPIAGVQVSLYFEGQFPDTPYRTTYTKPDGTYTFERLEGDRNYIVSFASPPGALPKASISFALENGHEKHLDVAYLTQN